MDILLTGATGCLGSALARHWAAAGHRVTALVRAGSDRRRLAAVADRLQWLPVDGPALADRIADHPASVLVHTACAYGRRGESPDELFEANVGVGLRLLQALLARPAGPACLLHTGTVLAPELNAYARGKRQFADEASRLARQYPQRLQCIELRLQHFYGPGDDATKFSSHVIASCRRHEPALALTDCTQRRDFIHVDDAVSAIDTVLQHRAELPAAATVDIGSGEAPPLRAFVETAHRLLGSRTRLDFGALPPRPHEPALCRADTARLRAWGWRPRHDLASGLQATIAAEAAGAAATSDDRERAACN